MMNATIRSERVTDNLGAFISHDSVAIKGAESGPLQGLTFAAKDLYDIAGHVTGAGNPEWLRTHEPASETAPAVQALLEAGADLVGKTHTDELAYSLNGENVHYGTPVNSAAPGRIPGGSSSGSASAVAGKAVDFALGSDTGGSVRIPASYCGLFGLRPTHGRIPIDHAVPLAPSFDTVGWFSRDGELFRRLGQVLLPGYAAKPRPSSMMLARDAFDMLPGEIASALAPAVVRLAGLIGNGVEMTVSPDGLDTWMPHFRVLQAFEVWQCHGDWVSAHDPNFGPGVRDRFEMAAGISETEAATHRPARAAIAERMNDLLADGAVLCLPTAPGIAPLRETPADELDDFRYRILALTCIAGLSGCPQITFPLATYQNCPLGLSLMARRGDDEVLLDIAAEIGAA